MEGGLHKIEDTCGMFAAHFGLAVFVHRHLLKMIKEKWLCMTHLAIRNYCTLDGLVYCMN